MKINCLTFIATMVWFPTTYAFSVINSPGTRRSHTKLLAGGFEWEDPTAAFDQGVENPFKNPDLITTSGGDGDMKIDPARLLGPRLSGSNLYFIGMMGSGKSAVGNTLARRMGTYNFLDTDEIIEKATNMTIPKIFEMEGEEVFRQVEAQILDSVHAYVRCVVSTGGGIVCRMQNWSKLQTGIVVWLDVHPEIIYNRIQGTDRPLLQTENPLQTLKDLSEQRRERYEQADVRIEVTEDMDEHSVADAVIRALHDFIDDNPPAWKMAKAKAQSEGLDWVQ
jgi:shikimate kinase